MSAEEWRPIPGFPGYEVSSYGRLISRRRGAPRVISTPVASKGYPVVRLGRGSREDQQTFNLHRLVALAFYGPAPEGMQVRHLDGNRLNNHLDNLRYGTPSENNQDTLRHGTHPEASKTHCKRGHPFDEANTYSTPRGRECRTCRRIHGAAHRRRRGIPTRTLTAQN